MAGLGNVVPLSERSAPGLSVEVISPAFTDNTSRLATGEQLISRPSLRCGPVQELRPATVMGGLAVADKASAPNEMGSPSLGLTEWEIGSSVVVSVSGEVDIATTSQLSEALRAALRRRPKKLICDLNGVGFLGAAGLTTLLVARRRAIARDAWFDLVCSRRHPRKLIALVGLDALLSLHQSVAAAAAAQAQRGGLPGRLPLRAADDLASPI